MSERTALVTGASSGLGLEAAALLAEQGYGRVIVTARTTSKGQTAQQNLASRADSDVFEALTLDLNDPATIESAAEELTARGGKIDFLLLNAGIAPAKHLERTSQGIEATIAATLTGHHLLTVRLLEANLLSDDARIVIAGSEAARGDVPTFTPIDLASLADGSFDGDRRQAIEAVMRMSDGIDYNPSNTYATAKVFAAWWASQLALRLPSGMTVNTVSPGSTPDTNAARNAPAYMTYLMLPLIKLIPGMSHSVSDGAGRYLEAAKFGPEINGQFFASKPKKMTGALHRIDSETFQDVASQKALWDVTTAMTGAPYEA